MGAPPARAWVLNVETDTIRPVDVAELEQLQSQERQITAAEAVRHHMRSVR